MYTNQHLIFIYSFCNNSNKIFNDFITKCEFFSQYSKMHQNDVKLTFRAILTNKKVLNNEVGIIM